MTNTEAVVRRYYDTLNAYEPADAAARLADILTDAFVFHPPNNVDGYSGCARHLEWLAWHHRTVSQQRLMIDDIVAADTRAATRWTLSGVHTGEFLGVAPSGVRVNVTGQDYFRMDEHDKVLEMWRSMDLREVLRQMNGP